VLRQALPTVSAAILLAGMLRITLGLLVLLSLSATGAPKTPGIERAVSLPTRSINDGYALDGAVTNDGFSILLLAGLHVHATEVSPPATTPRGETEPLAIPRFARMAGLPQGIVTAWMEGARLFASVSAKVGDVGARRELPVFDSWLPQLRSVTTNRTHALVLSHDFERRHVWASILDAGGTPAGSAVDVVPQETIGRLAELTAASDPGGFLVLYRDEQQPLQLHAARVSNSGAVTRFTMHLDAGVTSALAAFDGTRYLIALQQGAAIRGILTPPNGSSRSEVFLIDADARLSAIAGRAGGSLLVCSNKAFVFEHATRTHGPDHKLGAVANFVVSDGEHALVAYANDRRFPTGTASAQWLDVQTGQPLGDSFALSYGSPRQSKPAAALGDPVDFLVWAERDPETLRDAIRGTRIARDGRPLDEPPLRLSLPGTENARPSVAFNGRDFVVAWHEQVGTAGQTSEQRLLVQRVSRGGRLLEPAPREIGRALFSWSDVEVAHSGDTTLILWIGPTGNVFQTLGRRMNGDGELLDPTPLRVTQEATPQHWTFDLAAGAGGFLVTWGQSDGTQESLHVAQITTGGAVRSAQRLHAWSSQAIYRPHVTWNGRHFLVVWNSTATMITSAIWAYSPLALPVSGVLELGSLDYSWAVVSATSHSFLDPWNPQFDAYRIATPLEEEEVIDPQIASDGTRAILTYTRPVREAPHGGSQRVMYRLYGDPVPAMRRRAVRP